MVIEKILFPAPNPPHYSLTSHHDHLFWIPAGQNPIKMPRIPCMFYSPRDNAKYFTIFCHGNGCDIGSMHELFDALCRRSDSYVLAFEYPSYGLCKGNIKPDKSTINQHAERAYAFAHETLNWPADRILIYGHSIGSGAACHIASTKIVAGLILQSPYTSINGLIREKVGDFVGSLVGNSYWNNLDAIRNIHCPTLFIHGQQDNLIPSQHSQTLHDSLAHVQNKELILVPNADHNSIPYHTILDNIQSFLDKFFSPSKESLPRIELDPELRTPPSKQEQSSITSTFSGILSPLFQLTRASTNATRSVYHSVFPKSSEENNNNNDNN